MSLTLVEDILDGSTTISELTKDELLELREYAFASGDHCIFRVVSNNVTGIYDYNEHAPYWLLNVFSDSIWNIEIKDNDKTFKKEINWDTVILDDGLKLTNPKHYALLNTFKYWITAVDNPRDNGGTFKKGGSVDAYMKIIISFINGILIHGELIQLSKYHLAGLSDDFLMAMLVKLAENGILGLYDYNSKIKSLLLKNITSISEEEAKAFGNKHPFIYRKLLTEEQELDLSVTDRVKACCWLEKVGYYQKTVIDKIQGKLISKAPQGNCTVFIKYIYGNKIIPMRYSFPYFEELKLCGTRQITEFKPIPNKDKSKGVNNKSIKRSIASLKLLNTIQGRDNTSQFPIDCTKELTVSRVNSHVRLKSIGRFTTLPVSLVFTLIKQCYEFTHDHQDSIQNSMLNVLGEILTKSPERQSNINYFPKSSSKHVPNTPETERTAWVQSQAMDFVDDKLKMMGVSRLYIPCTEDKTFDKKRENKSLFELYNVLVGSIQALTGVIMAKRQDELISLKSHGNLHPNIDPSTEQGKKVDYELEARLKKSGSGGKYGQNALIKRPITRSFALLIWKLEQFNLSAINANLNKGKLALFNSINPATFKLIKSCTKSFNIHLNCICDYFETPLVDFGHGEQRRFYIRQHQLRRFFAMVFFWSKGFDGLESLRWMLGHTDIEHLYHYISEEEKGAVLNGIKASCIVNAAQANKLDALEELANAIAERYGVNSANISLSTIAESIDDYGDVGDYKTIPHIDQLRKQETFESQVFDLLEDNIITYEPEFFTIIVDGKEIKDYSLTLQVCELD
jgi:hypothetical protein